MFTCADVIRFAARHPHSTCGMHALDEAANSIKPRRTVTASNQHRTR